MLRQLLLLLVLVQSGARAYLSNPLHALFVPAPHTSSARGTAPSCSATFSQSGLQVTGVQGLPMAPASLADDSAWKALHPIASESVGVNLPGTLLWRLRHATWYLEQDAAAARAIQRAAEVACVAHEGQKRKSGDDFILHPVETAIILADLKMDVDTIVAGLLHDTVEDTDLTLQDLTLLFGESVSAIVQGDTKVSKLNAEWGALPADERAALNHRSMLLAMSEDWRVVMVKLADRLHNMRTLEHMSRSKQVRIARETVQIFVPLARRVGVGEIERELLHWSIEYLFPQELKGLFGLELLGHWARLQFWGVLDDVLKRDQVLYEFDVDSKLLGHRQRWVQHTNHWAVVFAE